MYNYFEPDPAVKTAAQIAANTSHMLNLAAPLFNFAYGEDDRPIKTIDNSGSSPASYQEYDEASNTNQQEE